MATQKLPYVIPNHNETPEVTPPKPHVVQDHKEPPEVIRPGPPAGFEKDEDEKQNLISELVDTAFAVAMLLDAGAESHDEAIFRSLAFGLTKALQAAADRVCAYVLESPGALVSLKSSSHAIYLLEKRLADLKESGK
ncbi:MAG TPA: hypothetical protein VGR34_06530 [Candidatus Dormibacteraeota bacterium]|nr:hypothetical protein [Candidatus Dormibacteraeota bacterium]